MRDTPLRSTEPQGRESGAGKVLGNGTPFLHPKKQKFYLPLRNSKIPISLFLKHSWDVLTEGWPSILQR